VKVQGRLGREGKGGQRRELEEEGRRGE